jgi:hypothetical protein
MALIERPSLSIRLQSHTMAMHLEWFSVLIYLVSPSGKTSKFNYPKNEGKLEVIWRN